MDSISNSSSSIANMSLYLPSNISILLVIPFYNEEKSLPVLFKSFSKCKGGIKDVALIGVNHNSTDNSIITFNNLSSDFGYTEIVNETSLTPSVGVPRKTGLDKAAAISDCTKNNKTMILGSIDADAYVHTMFFEEARKLLSSQCDILIFPSRHLQKPLKEVISSQDALVKEDAIHTLLGIEWLKFQFREILYFIGAKETRCSSGVFLTRDSYEQIGGHRQYFSEQKLPISGESNALGIKANKQKMVTKVSKYITELNPRRYIKAIKENSNIQGYKKDKNDSKIFTRNDSTYVIPKPNKDQWCEFEKKSIKGSLSMLLARAACYKKLDQLTSLFEITSWHNLVAYYKQYLQDTIQDEEIYNIVGHGIFNRAFHYAYSEIGQNGIDLLIQKFSGIIPDNNTLLSWSDSEIYHPSLMLLKE